MNERRKPSWTVWIGAALFVAPVIYLLSIGPADWLVLHGDISEPSKDFLRSAYAPVAWSARYGPAWWKSALDAYLELWE